MKKLIQKINLIPKDYFSLNDLRKVSGLKEGSLKVAVNRLVKDRELIKIGQGFYTLEMAKIDWEKLAVEFYAPSYLSFEWVLAKYNILSQKPIHLTLATLKRAKIVKTPVKNIIYHHLQSRLFWGYEKQGDILIAKPAKAFLDLAYLSLNGYAKFDIEEMDLEFLDKAELKKYLEKFKSKRLKSLVSKLAKL